LLIIVLVPEAMINRLNLNGLISKNIARLVYSFFSSEIYIYGKNNE